MTNRESLIILARRAAVRLDALAAEHRLAVAAVREELQKLPQEAAALPEAERRQVLAEFYWHCPQAPAGEIARALGVRGAGDLAAELVEFAPELSCSECESPLGRVARNRGDLASRRLCRACAEAGAEERRQILEAQDERFRRSVQLEREAAIAEAYTETKGQCAACRVSPAEEALGIDANGALGASTRFALVCSECARRIRTNHAEVMAQVRALERRSQDWRTLATEDPSSE